MKLVDLYGAIGENGTDEADGLQAYTQVPLKNKEVRTWVTLPKEYWPPHFHNIDNPVVPLNYALYGHPDAGTYWEQKSHSKVLSVGFERVPGDWDSLFYHPVHKLMLTIYVALLIISTISTAYFADTLEFNHYYSWAANTAAFGFISFVLLRMFAFPLSEGRITRKERVEEFRNRRRA